MPGRPPGDVMAAANDLETHVIATRRADILKGLGDRPVTLVGGVSDAVRRDLPNTVTEAGMLTFEDAMDLAARARVLINSSPSFRNGAHERLFYGIARGAYVLTEPTRFLSSDDLADIGAGAMPFDAAGIGAVVDRALDRDDEDRDTTMTRYAATHNWRCRLEPVMEAVKETFWADA